MWKLHFWNAENCNPKVQHIFNVSKNIDWPDEIKYFPIYSDWVKSIGRSVLTFGLILPEFHPHLFQRIVNVSKTMNNAQWEFARPVLKNLKLKLEVRWVLQNWGKTEAFRCFLRKWKSIKNWLRYKQFSDFPNSKIFAGMLKKLAAQLSHCAMPCTRRDMRFSVFTNNI